MKRKLTSFFHALAVLCLAWGMVACEPDNSGEGGQDGGNNTEQDGGSGNTDTGEPGENGGDGNTAPYGETYVETALGVDMKMVYVDSGSFLMGATEEQGGYAEGDERPVHKVSLSPYYIATVEVTQAQWKAVMGSDPSKFKGDNLPVESVNWEEAMDFCERLSEVTGKKYVLPTEAQWEFAARGGNLSQGYKYSGSDSIGEVAWYSENSGGQTHPVGEKKANELGLYDMSGNVWEWCLDWYGTYSPEDAVNPQGPEEGSYRVFRGGSWSSIARHCRVSDRSDSSPGDRYLSLGFRVVCLP